MKKIFDQISHASSKTITQAYSTSFSLATQLLAPSIRQDIYNIYGFVRVADEIVDSFHNYDKEALLKSFSAEMELAIQQKISLNPVLNSFQHTVHKYGIEKELYLSFLESMAMDLHKTTYLTTEEFKKYIYGSADVVGLMCLRVFVQGDHEKYQHLKEAAMRLGSAFQKVNFLRDLKDDHDSLNRSYFPNVDLNALDEVSKKEIIEDIEADFRAGYKGIIELPVEAKLGVYCAYIYYSKLLQKLKKLPSLEIKKKRIRVSNYQKAGLLAKSYISYRLNFL